ncbi:polar amino acid transport system permease protein [Skermanella aerolata]|uniref:Ectoine/hydroxyectoine ABC transporter permease subunit EhuC n=1 Tax=Skermanella aerolata TaxID=393310 RepID=A0A512DMH9_9PROT|nr:ectoine/hydroxyectoine ABC transporter permease subunit EhuC [Skermanella aerolata]KJB96543.1 amino acid ABC transporter permease [Skermanella aerolata KACC 11604]GEO37658.1 ectoine/hydroxyectoine ABC transporter permease subunit EhuC [Skermanella aerolata]
MFLPIEFYGNLLQGALITIQITAMAGVLAFVCALVAGLARMSSWRPVRWTAVTYVEFFRGTSALVQLFWLFYALPLFGLSLSPMTVAVLGLGLHIGAYGAEVVRSAVLAIPRGQHEAALALNMSPALAMRRVILPQAVVAMLPPFNNLMIELLKATALVSLITITDLTFQGQLLNTATLKTAPIFMAVLVFYFLIALGITSVFRTLERRLSVGRLKGMAR